MVTITSYHCIVRTSNVDPQDASVEVHNCMELMVLVELRLMLFSCHHLQIILVQINRINDEEEVPNSEVEVPNDLVVGSKDMLQIGV